VTGPGRCPGPFLLGADNLLRKLAGGLLALALLCLPLGSVAGNEGRQPDDKKGDPTKPSDSPDKVMKDTLKLLNEMADAIESAKDKDSAEKARTKLEALEKKFRDIGDRAKKLKVTNEAGKKLAEKYKDDLEKATKRMVQAGLQLGKNADAAQIILPALQKIQKAATELQGDLGKKQAPDKR